MVQATLQSGLVGSLAVFAITAAMVWWAGKPRLGAGGQQSARGEPELEQGISPIVVEPGEPMPNPWSLRS